MYSSASLWLIETQKAYKQEASIFGATATPIDEEIVLRQKENILTTTIIPLAIRKISKTNYHLMTSSERPHSTVPSAVKPRPPFIQACQTPWRPPPRPLDFENQACTPIKKRSTKSCRYQKNISTLTELLSDEMEGLSLRI